MYTRIFFRKTQKSDGRFEQIAEAERREAMDLM